MLDATTKSRIDSARQILVGKVPDPKSQVEQITIALIYKFMDDMDRQAEELGGKASFFKGEFKKYRWADLLDKRFGGHERLLLYAEGIERMTENTNIPQLFRDIFKGVFLPYRDPETLNLFLKEINGFTYDHSEKLGDAYEYLLSVLGTQGDAGQFRTPRHIIDFIVAVVDPQKHDTILDPACGTAGFLISAYKHILAAPSDSSDPSDPSDRRRPLTPDERAQLMKNFRGYDIAPDMVRLSRVNLYLHGFPNPTIHEYDTLTSEERWDERYDVIMANPPFMSPKGGIRPHNRFSIKANRSEVLFVDYIAEHLNPGGRAGIIVPEGIIFQSQNAYKALRKMLVENYLWAVVSLPAGVFNPYAGVKTSILFLDRNLARRADSVLFVKIENDGFDLGAQRRPIQQNDLPAALRTLQDWKTSSRPTRPTAQTHAVPRQRLLEAPDISLSGDRYRAVEVRGTGKWPMVKLGEVCSFEYGTSLPEKKRVPGPYPVVGSNGITGSHNEFTVKGPTIVVGRKGSAGEVTWIEQDCVPIDTTYYVQLKGETVELRYLFYMLQQSQLTELRGGAGVPGLNRNDAYEKELPLPPLAEQERLVAEWEGYRKVIEAARQILAHYKPTLRLDPKWPMIEIGKVCTLINGRAFKPSDWEKKEGGGMPIIRIQNLNDPTADFNYYSRHVPEKLIVRKGQLLFSWSGSRGTSFGPHVWNRDEAGILNQHIFKVEFPKTVLRDYLYLALKMAVTEVEENLHGGVGLVHITKGNLERIQIPLPPLAVQRALVAELEAERALVEANRELAARFERKLQASVAAVWGAPSEASAPSDSSDSPP
jgi:type I restriction enzyme M protein